VLTADDVPGSATYGLEVSDQPVFARDSVHYVGQPVAAVAAEHPETARQALAAIVVDYEVLAPLIDAEDALARGEIFRSLPIRHGDPSVTGEVVVEGTYQVGMQDQAFMGPECGLAIPDHDGGGVELFISTQYLHVDRVQVAACLDLPEESVRLTLAGVGGAFGAREDVSLQVHCCLLALRIGRPVKMSYSRPESFVGHVHRHPAQMWYRHHAGLDGTIVKGRGPPAARRRGLRIIVARRHSPTRRASPSGPTRSPTRWSSRTRCAPTTRPVARCVASERFRPASRTRHRWTGWRQPSAWTPSSYA